MTLTPEPILRHLPVGEPASTKGDTRQMAYWDWAAGPQAAPHSVVVCVHGLSRQGRDFDSLARRLQERSRVISVDVAGRGHSDWLADPMGYQIPTYARDLAILLTVLRQADPEVRIDWIGTSMGGLIGMGIASQPALAPRKLVLNDVGPVIEWESLQRIGTYVGTNPSFDSEQAAIDYLLSISQGFGQHSDDTWRTLSQPMLREREGRWWLHYDPSIAVPFKALMAGNEADSRAAVQQGEAALWAAYDAITAPTLLLRGADSDLLSRPTAERMGQRGPKARCVEFEGVGHAPTLVDPLQQQAVIDFLWAD